MFICKNAHIPPLHPSIVEALPLTTQERMSAKIFALPADMWPTDSGHETGRFAVAESMAFEEWDTLAQGQPVLYTELYVFPEAENAGNAALVTHMGEMQACSIEQNLFWATTWQDGESTSINVAASQVKGVWRVSRFICL